MSRLHSSYSLNNDPFSVGQAYPQLGGPLQNLLPLLELLRSFLQTQGVDLPENLFLGTGLNAQSVQRSLDTARRRSIITDLSRISAEEFAQSATDTLRAGLRRHGLLERHESQLADVKNFLSLAGGKVELVGGLQNETVRRFFDLVSAGNISPAVLAAGSMDAVIDPFSGVRRITTAESALAMAREQAHFLTEYDEQGIRRSRGFTGNELAYILGDMRRRGLLNMGRSEALSLAMSPRFADGQYSDPTLMSAVRLRQLGIREEDDLNRLYDVPLTRLVTADDVELFRDKEEQRREQINRANLQRIAGMSDRLQDLDDLPKNEQTSLLAEYLAATKSNLAREDLEIAQDLTEVLRATREGNAERLQGTKFGRRSFEEQLELVQDVTGREQDQILQDLSKSTAESLRKLTADTIGDPFGAQEGEITETTLTTNARKIETAIADRVELISAVRDTLLDEGIAAQIGDLIEISGTLEQQLTHGAPGQVPDLARTIRSIGIGLHESGLTMGAASAFAEQATQIAARSGLPASDIAGLTESMVAAYQVNQSLADSPIVGAPTPRQAALRQVQLQAYSRRLPSRAAAALMGYFAEENIDLEFTDTEIGQEFAEQIQRLRDGENLSPDFVEKYMRGNQGTFAAHLARATDGQARSVVMYDILRSPTILTHGRRVQEHVVGLETEKRLREHLLPTAKRLAQRLLPDNEKAVDVLADVVVESLIGPDPLSSEIFEDSTTTGEIWAGMVNERVELTDDEEEQIRDLGHLLFQNLGEGGLLGLRALNPVEVMRQEKINDIRSALQSHLSDEQLTGLEGVIESFRQISEDPEDVGDLLGDVFKAAGLVKLEDVKGRVGVFEENIDKRLEKAQENKDEFEIKILKELRTRITDVIKDADNSRKEAIEEKTKAEADQKKAEETESTPGGDKSIAISEMNATFNFKDVELRGLLGEGIGKGNTRNRVVAS